MNMKLIETLKRIADTLDSVRGDINPERGYADDLEKEVQAAFAAAHALIGELEQAIDQFPDSTALHAMLEKP